jgi:hypothetical protein
MALDGLKVPAPVAEALAGSFGASQCAETFFDQVDVSVAKNPA